MVLLMPVTSSVTPAIHFKNSLAHASGALILFSALQASRGVSAKLRERLCLCAHTCVIRQTIGISASSAASLPSPRPCHAELSVDASLRPDSAWEGRRCARRSRSATPNPAPRRPRWVSVMNTASARSCFQRIAHVHTPF